MTDTMRIRGTDFEVGPAVNVDLTGRERLIICDALAGLMARACSPDELTEAMHVMQRLTGVRDPKARVGFADRLERLAKRLDLASTFNVAPGSAIRELRKVRKELRVIACEIRGVE